VAGFTHHIENLLDRVREKAVPVSPEVVDIVLKSSDHLKLLLNAERGGATVAEDAGEKLIGIIRRLAMQDEPAQANSHKYDAGHTATQTSGRSGGDANCVWRIEFHPHPGMLANGGNPPALFAELRELGECEIVAHANEVPGLDAAAPDICYLWWTMTLRADVEENAIRDVFIFVEEGARLKIERIEVRPRHEPPTGEAVTRQSAPAAAAPQKTLTKESTVRVPAERLDRLVNLVGELSMNQSRLAQAASMNGAPEFANPIQELERLVAELREDVLGIRMFPIGTLFGRFRRLVHDLSAELGKEVDLVTEGAETELDKSILDQLGEPLVHCLRNCIDHAIEPAPERLELGKTRRGEIRLSAIHRGSDVVISIHDDGRGVNRRAVRAKAIEKQLIAPDANLSDRDIVNLILLPGFSTARQVTNVSGRGVGMDAVKRQIDTLRGTFSLSSEEGKGTRVSITLPLTLAIIDGLLVEIGGDQFIIPMSAVTENVELHRAERARKNGRNVIAVRGELISYIDLRSTFGIRGDAPEIEKVVIVRHEDGRAAGLVVDRVLGTHQTVIQSLGQFFRNTKVVSGATIMGDGRVSLILDTAAVIGLAECKSVAAPVPSWADAEQRAAC
jgi:two-component system chemotaxis sensor kinase CheA